MLTRRNAFWKIPALLDRLYIFFDFASGEAKALRKNNIIDIFINESMIYINKCITATTIRPIRFNSPGHEGRSNFGYVKINKCWTKLVRNRYNL